MEVYQELVFVILLFAAFKGDGIFFSLIVTMMHALQLTSPMAFEEGLPDNQNGWRDFQSILELQLF